MTEFKKGDWVRVKPDTGYKPRSFKIETIEGAWWGGSGVCRTTINGVVIGYFLEDIEHIQLEPLPMEDLV